MIPDGAPEAPAVPVSARQPLPKAQSDRNAKGAEPQPALPLF